MKRINLWMLTCGRACSRSTKQAGLFCTRLIAGLAAIQAVEAVGSAVNLRDSQPTKADIDPLTEQLNKALTFTVMQRSTGKTAEGKIVTAEIEGIYQPALALRFAGESDFQVMYDRMSSADRANYQSLLQSFDAPLRQLDKLFKAFDKKRQEFDTVNPFRGL
jgi:hypothetical protein